MFLLPSGLRSTRPGRSPPPVLDGIPLSGLPWSHAGLSSTTFGLAPHGSAVSSRSPSTSRSPHHRPQWAGSRFCSGADHLWSRLLAPCVLLRGRNFPRRSPWPVHRLASRNTPEIDHLTVSRSSCLSTMTAPSSRPHDYRRGEASFIGRPSPGRTHR